MVKTVTSVWGLLVQEEYYDIGYLPVTSFYYQLVQVEADYIIHCCTGHFFLFFFFLLFIDLGTQIWSKLSQVFKIF